jgi:uncharacterized protein YegL
MTWIILALLALLALWVGAGVLMLMRSSRRPGTDYRRGVAERVYVVGEEIEVDLKLVAPANMQLAGDHDVLLIIDHSGSMGSGPGSPLREAVRAAENFIRRLPDNIHVGVMGFDHEARLLSPLTNQPRQALRAIGALGAGGGTAIHAALENSRDALIAGRPGVKKTIIMLSDGSSEQGLAEAAAAKLRQEIEKLTIICVGFGAQVNESLLRSIASDKDKYLHVSNTDDLHSLFSFLAATVSGQMAVAGLIDEGARAPHPFRLMRTGGLYPIGVQPASPSRGDATRIVWSIPLMNEEPVPLTYNLMPECPGWHKVAAADSKSTWRMPDGTRREMQGPDGPYVLVMPRWLGWAWPVLNPLFWMLFGRFWPCRVKAAESVIVPEPEPLPVAALPALPPAPQERVYKPDVRQAVVVGLGEVGEWVVCRLKERLRDRMVDPARVDVLAIHVTHRVNREPARVWNTVLDPHEQVEIHQDLRPYLETLRDNGVPPLRHWIPWHRWLAEMPPLTTLRTIADDRRKARLAIIRQPEPIEAKLESGLRRVVEHDGVVIVVGSIADAECSGMLAEVAHICAAHGAGVTALFAPTSFFDTPAAEELALALELERMSLMSGGQIISDRHQPPVAARRLFDRIIVLEQKRETAFEASLPAAELIWNMLAYEGVFKQLPLLRAEGNEVICCGAAIDSYKLPVASLWNWVRERTLALGVNGQRFKLLEKAGRLVLPDTNRQAVNDDVEAFWMGQYCRRPQSLLLQSLRSALQAINSDSISALLSLQDVVPIDQPYHEQVAYSRRERQAFAAYVEEWCQHILQREQERGVWGVHILMPALLSLGNDLQLVISRIKRLSGNADFANLVNFASALLVDFLSIISNLQSDLAHWVAKMVGPQLELHVGPPPDGATPVAYDIENKRQKTEKVLASLDARDREFLNRWFQDWYNNYGGPLLDQLSFRAVREPDGQQVSIKLRYANQELGANSDLAATLRAALDQYGDTVLGWPVEQMLQSEEVANPLECFRVGKHSARVYPEVERVADEEDPFVAAAIRVQERTLKQALGVNLLPPGEVPYIWPEEANAARIAQKIRNQLRRDPQPFSPIVIHLMRDTQKLHGFMNDLAQGRVITQKTKYILQREGHDYEIGPTDEKLQGLDAFQSVVQQVVSYELSLNGQPIPPPSPNSMNSFDETIKAIETHPLGRMAVNSPNWKMWQDVVHGLMLEYDM